MHWYSGGFRTVNRLSPLHFGEYVKKTRDKNNEGSGGGGGGVGWTTWARRSPVREVTLKNKQTTNYTAVVVVTALNDQSKHAQ